ncbi:hypothetical protein OHA91_38690 [Streptomyces erythrochromogenes]|uniref:Uncharacterized protein n=1 Tax=Streptomyces erythrochromogenes TaxID=285574 RepID=A0ABZ1QMK9_9ACTN|nr:hypothetical protein [Streptomyces erythrochromogenes]
MRRPSAPAHPGTVTAAARRRPVRRPGTVTAAARPPEPPRPGTVTAAARPGTVTAAARPGTVTATPAPGPDAGHRGRPPAPDLPPRDRYRGRPPALAARPGAVTAAPARPEPPRPGPGGVSDLTAATPDRIPTRRPALRPLPAEHP